MTVAIAPMMNPKRNMDLLRLAGVTVRPGREKKPCGEVGCPLSLSKTAAPG